MSNEELIKEYLKQIEDLELERFVFISQCQKTDEKLKVYDDYDKDIKAYKEEINKLSDLVR